MKAPPIPLLAHIETLITQTIWTSEQSAWVSGVLICCGNYDPTIPGRKHCMILDKPQQLPDPDEGHVARLCNFYDFDKRQDKPIKILNVLTPDEAYTHPHEYVRLAMKAIKVGQEPLDYINEWQEGGGTFQRRFTRDETRNGQSW